MFGKKATHRGIQIDRCSREVGLVVAVSCNSQRPVIVTVVFVSAL